LQPSDVSSADVGAHDGAIRPAEGLGASLLDMLYVGSGVVKDE